MNTLEEAFRVNVVNNPDLDDSLKQDAMLKYQRKLSSFIPNERVQTQQESLDQSLQQHGVTKQWFQSRRNSQGVQEWEPLGGGRGGDKQVDPAKEAQRLQKLDLERATRLQEITKQVTNERDPDNLDVALFKNTKEDPDVIDREVMKRFSDLERIYTGGGNEPHPIFQRAAQKAAQKEREAQQKAGYDQWYEEYKQEQVDNPRALRAPQQQMQPDAQPMTQQVPAAQPKPPVKQKPVTLSSTNIDQQITQSEYDGETEVAAALAAVKRITANGVPDEKSPEYAELYDALRFLNAKGVQIDGEPNPSKTDIYGDLMLNGMR